MVAKGCGPSLNVAVIMGRFQGESCCPQPDRGNPAVRDETGGCRKLIEARNEAPACSDEEPVTATPRCPPMQRLRSIPTRKRPLGVPVLEDKIVQRATVEVLNAIYETDFLGFSYGFRPGRSQHNALDALYTGLLTKNVNWVLDVDIRSFFGAPG